MKGGSGQGGREVGCRGIAKEGVRIPQPSTAGLSFTDAMFCSFSKDDLSLPAESN